MSNKNFHRNLKIQNKQLKQSNSFPLAVQYIQIHETMINQGLLTTVNLISSDICGFAGS